MVTYNITLIVTGTVLIIGVLVFLLIDLEKKNSVTFKFQGRNLRMTKAQKEQWDIMDDNQRRRAVKDLKKVIREKGINN